MSFRIAIASGKGGTGKTTVALSLYYFLSKIGISDVRLVDCDVEEPNDLIFFKDSELMDTSEVNQIIPLIDESKCSFCSKCVEFCEFNAISVIPSAEYAKVDPELCHSCGACSYVCEDDAISEYDQEIGKIRNYKNPFGNLSEGRLKVGSVMHSMMIRKLKESIPTEDSLILYDSPPGTSCSVVETVNDADFVILVAEPTPFGIHDLKLMVELLRDLGKRFGVVINKDGIGSQEMNLFLSEEKIEILAGIPFSRNYAMAYSAGKLFNGIPEDVEAAYKKLIDKLMLKIINA